MPKSKDLSELNEIYSSAESEDREVFAEMRSNILLVAGDHYARRDKYAGARTTAERERSDKIRLVKNHMYRTSKTYRNSILEESPMPKIAPQIETDLQDQKDAELNQAVWLDIVRRHKIKGKVREWAKDYVNIGEVATKIFWDPMAGDFLGYEDMIDEETGETVMEETGEHEPVIDPVTGMQAIDEETLEALFQPIMQPRKDETKPIFSGDLVFEEVFGFNILREAGASSMDERDKCLIIRKMIPTKDLKRRYAGDEEKLKAISESSKETYVIFDASRGSYEKSKGQTLMREFYWRPCTEYPRGWYVYATKMGILEEGELPGGIFPIIWEGFDKHQTSPRGRSPLKVARPYQAEINRASSKTAEAQVTLGDDKLIYQIGSKLQKGELLPGVRGISYAGGQPPVVIPGRDGSQYMGYIKDQIQELDLATMIGEIMQPKDGMPIDPYALLYAAASRKRANSEHTEKFEEFLVRVAELVLEILKIYLPDDALISAVGARERVNIVEFRKTTKLSHQIVIEPGVETVTSQLGRQLTFQHILQYVGKDIDKDTLGRILQNVPFGNNKDSFEHLTLDSDVAKNEMLALERGEAVQPTQYVEPEFMLKKITARMKTPEYAYFDEMIKQNYEQLKQGYEQLLAQATEKALAAKNEFIPVDGALVGVDLYINDPKNPEASSKRARIPQRAVEWLIKTLEMQGATLEKLEGMNANVLAEVADKVMGGQQAAPQPQGQMMPPQMPAA